MKSALMIVILLVLPTHLFGVDLDIQSKVTKVTLFQDRAEITRSGTVTVAGGKNIISFVGVPQSLNADSLGVKGRGVDGITILGVEYKTRYLKDEVSKDAQALKDKIEGFNKQIANLTAAKIRLDSQKTMISGISIDAKIPTEQQGTTRPRTAVEMDQVLKFISESTAKLDEEIRLNNDKSDAIKKELEVAQNELSNFAPSNRVESVVEVEALAKEVGKLSLDITYQIGGANWFPTYNLTVDESKEQAFELDTFGVVSQRTGEDWEEVELALSTARPNIGLARPIPIPRYLDIAQVIALGASSGIASAQRAFPMKANKSSLEFEEGKLDQAKAENSVADEFLERDSKQQLSQVTDVGVIEYRIPSKVSVKSDGSTEKLKLAETTLSGKILNVVVPAYTTNVYREAKIENSSTAPILPGTVNVFSVGKFIGKQSFPFVPSGKEIKIPVGISEEFVVSRRLVKRFEDDSGIVRSFRRISNEYEVEVENVSKKSADIVVLEPAPVSRNEKIKVSLDKQEPKSISVEDKSRVQSDAGIYEWHLSVPSKQKQKINYSSSVEFATDANVIGIEGL